MELPYKLGLGGVVLILCFILFFFDDRIFTLWRVGSQSPGAFSVQHLRSLVWRGPVSNPLRRRSIFNPSLVYDSERSRWLVIARYTRGRRIGQCLLQYLLDDDEVKLRNELYRATMILYVFNEEFEKLSEEPVFVNKFWGTNDPLTWQGEDPRIYFDEEGRVAVQATVHGRAGEIKLGRGKLVRMDGKLTWQLKRVVQSGKPQKNWAPTPKLRDGSQIFLTNVYPRWRCATLSADGVPNLVVDQMSPVVLKGLRCTSPCRPLTDKTLLTCLHSTHPYKTYLAEICSETLLPIRVSPPLDFSPEQSYIEFASGLEIVGDRVYIGMGINDAQSEIYLLSRGDVDGLMVIPLRMN